MAATHPRNGPVPQRIEAGRTASRRERTHRDEYVSPENRQQGESTQVAEGAFERRPGSPRPLLHAAILGCCPVDDRLGVWRHHSVLSQERLMASFRKHLTLTACALAGAAALIAPRVRAAGPACDPNNGGITL